MNRVHCRVCAVVLFFLVTLAFSPGYALESIPEPAPLPSSLKPHVERVLPSKPDDFFAVLKNGLTVLVRRQPQSDVTSSHVFVRAGSLYEDRYMTSGLSHYLEHVVSGGTTASFSEKEARNRLQRLGGASNAYTSFDRTVYYIDTSSQHWREALDLLLSYVSECSLDPKEVSREKSVIQQEFKLGENNVSRELWKLFTHTAYQVHPVRHPIIGYEEVFVRRNREDLKEYYSERYQPQNMTVSVVGDVDPVEVIEFVA
jgi:zinc protease